MCLHIIVPAKSGWKHQRIMEESYYHQSYIYSCGCAGVPQHYELKELLALVPRYRTPSNDDAEASVARPSLSSGSDHHGLATGQQTIPLVSALTSHIVIQTGDNTDTIITTIFNITALPARGKVRLQTSCM